MNYKAHKYTKGRVKWLIAPLVMLIVILLCLPVKVYAYLDLGTGSYVLQILMAFIFGGVFAIKIYWKKIKVFFTEIVSNKNRDKIDGA